MWRVDVVEHALASSLLCSGATVVAFNASNNSVFSSVLLFLQVFLILALFAIYAFVFSPAIATLNAVLRNARGTLLQFPEDVITCIPSVRALVKDFAKASQQE